VPATFFATTKGSDPGFVNRPARQLRLTAISACRNQGLNVLTFLDGTGASHSGLPGFEYLNHLRSRARPTDDRPDLGAYEYSVPVISALELRGDDCVIVFASAAGHQYDLQHSRDLGSNVWLPVMTNIPGIDGSLQIIDPNAARELKRFYRVKATL